MKKDQPDFLAAITRYQDGESIGDIAPSLGISRQSLWDRFRRAGVQLRPQKRTGQDNHFFRGGGRKLTERGYVRIYVNGRWSYEHRVVMERVLGRRLTPQEDIHHRNMIRHDNRPENLEIKTKFQHLSDHKTGRIVPPNVIEKQRQKMLGNWMHRPDITVQAVVSLKKQGLSINKISQQLGCSWGAVKARLRVCTNEQPNFEFVPGHRTS